MNLSNFPLNINKV